MSETQNNETWCVWVNCAEKIITVKENIGGKKVLFTNKKEGTEFVAKLVLQGYKIG